MYLLVGHASDAANEYGKVFGIFQQLNVLEQHRTVEVGLVRVIFDAFQMIHGYVVVVRVGRMMHVVGMGRV